PVNRQVLWERNLMGTVGFPNLVNLVPDPQDGMPLLVYQDGWVQKLGDLGPVSAASVVMLTREGLLALEPRTGALLWSRSDVGMRTHVFGDESFLFLVEADGQGVPTATRVLRAADGVEVKVPDFTALYKQPSGVSGGRRLLVAQNDGKGTSLRLYDILTGKDVWQKTFPAGSVV